MEGNLLNELLAGVDPFYVRVGVVVVMALIVLIAFASYNRIAKLASLCDRARADIDVQLRQRHDMIPNLVESVRGFAQHERAVIDSLMTARAAAMRAATPQDREKAEGEVTTRLGFILTTIENYPEVKGSQHFTQLSREIADVEHKISATRRYFNMAVAEYNATLTQFPGVAIAWLFRTNPRALFDIGPQRDAVEQAPAVRF
jgi:LemA protein